MFADLAIWTKTVVLPHGEIGLFVLSFLESFIFPLAPDFLFIPMSLARPEMVRTFTLAVISGSALGACVGYVLGLKGGVILLQRYLKKETITGAENAFKKWGAWAVGVCAFTPMPFKLFTWSSGAFHMDFKKFLLASLIGRSLRFVFEAYLIVNYGEGLIETAIHNFELILWVLLLVTLTYLGYRYFLNKHNGTSNTE